MHGANDGREASQSGPVSLRRPDPRGELRRRLHVRREHHSAPVGLNGRPLRQREQQNRESGLGGRGRGEGADWEGKHRQGGDPAGEGASLPAPRLRSGWQKRRGADFRRNSFQVEPRRQDDRVRVGRVAGCRRRVPGDGLGQDQDQLEQRG